MSRATSRWRLVLGALLALGLSAGVASGDAVETLRKESRSYRYEVPTARELRIAESLFEVLLAGASRLDKAIRLCRELELELILVNQRGEDFLVLTEVGDGSRGRGFYAFRRAHARPVAIQAPHTFHDRHTGVIASSLFAESQAVAVAWNTVVRSYSPRAAPAASGALADLAHARRSYYQAFTRAFARTYPRGVVVQLHGFSKEKRVTPGGALSDVIVSGGTRGPDVWVRTFAACLDEKLDVLVSLYPRDVSELGGTRNAQGGLLRSLDHTGFLHIEMSGRTRRALEGSAALRRRFWACLPGLPR